MRPEPLTQSAPVKQASRLTDVDMLNARFGADPTEALRFALSGALGRLAVVSSFGADSAVLLHMVAQIDRNVPVILIDTLLLFPETLAYHDRLTRHLGFSNVMRTQPNRVDLFLNDPDAVLHKSDPDACCDLRKARSLDWALRDFDGWISGRKRFQSGARTGLEVFERDPHNGRIKINPLARFAAADLIAYLDRHALPRHPLVARGYPSIGCAPCTTPAAQGEDPRAGRWRGQGKTECGIHVVDGKIKRRVS
jgi:phosphoadenosine phosphosulfate reductase